MSETTQNTSHDDYSLSRVPQHAKKPLWQIIVIRLGCFACVSQLMTGAALGFGMSFHDALLAVFLGSIALLIVGAAVGVIAAQQGLSTSLLARWSGFGNQGSALIGVIIAISSIGWFGMQNTVFAEGMYQATGILNLQIWSVLTGASIIAIVYFGISSLSWTANIALPLFLVAIGISSIQMFRGHSLTDLIASPIPGPALSLATGATMVAGSFIIGAVISPDICRFLKRGRDVFWMTLISTFVGELSMCMLAVLMAHAIKSADVMTIIVSLSGLIGVIIVIFSTIKVNDINLYAASLGMTNALNALFKKDFDRRQMTIILGVFGTALSVIGVINYFENFLVVLGVAIPPIAGIISIDYFILKRDRKILDESKERGELPDKVENWNPVAILAWAVGSLVGYFVQIGIPSINSLIVSGLLYYGAMKVYGLIQKKEIVRFRMVDSQSEG
ncbi:purine-cytosine permease family protein [Desulfitobacterium hafniense]|uniref:Cytosine permease n=5 Tax=root TaxID=1 RepID=Q24YJ2_DESHY|nr:cytosine permease [Desulfitobacterium hafniense]ACL20232.1 permease for cytosine/purines uracil thiamine allantoin [Desulfitobacterium hafniense DCB-2]EHL05808.1 NCS1 nucleoside transporter family protein [Desulfitobacterium hafniense DP7]KTE90438.1 allantoin permease [Desulfitobacterium hafniense]MEA5021757.1 cytosine permease [Desulfitobacterium hafniense]CDX01033.1 Cytosine permease [Desulfitobacterium hafniense]